MNLKILNCDVMEGLRQLDAGSVNLCVTSPPYWNLRDYGVEGQIGMEATPDAFVKRLVEVFREVRRVLADDGNLYLNIGDSYAQGKRGRDDNSRERRQALDAPGPGGGTKAQERGNDGVPRLAPEGLKPKDICGIPWRLALALQADGWYLREDIIWAKPNGMPESVQDRCTRAHEYIFHLTKQPKYYYNAEAIRRKPAESSIARLSQDIENQRGSDRANGGRKTNGTMKAVCRKDKQRGHGRRHNGFNERWDSMSKAKQQAMGSNERSWWMISTKPFSEAHFATFPPEIPRRCILAASRPGDVVLDPFAGSMTTGVVALEEGRKAVMIELNPEYVEIGNRRCNAVTLGLGI